MILLFEGCDCSGKSTLIKEQFNDIRYVHHGAYPTPTDAFQAYDELLDSLLPNEDIVLDRMHISERIYGQVYHDAWMSDERYSYLEHRLSQLKTIVIFCRPPLRVVIDQWRQRQHDEMIKDVNKIEEVYIEYSSLWKYTLLPVFTYDWTNQDYNKHMSIHSRIGEVWNYIYNENN